MDHMRKNNDEFWGSTDRDEDGQHQRGYGLAHIEAPSVDGPPVEPNRVIFE